MLNIGICDDDEEFICELENLLIKYLKKNNFTADIQSFSDSQDLIKYLKNEEDMDLLFLDIKLDDITGIDIGNNLRTELHNDLIQIVFVSSKESYAMQLFDIRPLNFILKPIDYKKVEYIMDEYNRLFRVQQNFFKYHIGKQTYKIDEKSIMYLQSMGRKISMFTTIGNKEFYGKLSDVYSDLKAYSFFEIHKSYIVNTRYVIEYSKDHVVMANGDMIPVSRSMRDKLNNLIIDGEWGV